MEYMFFETYHIIYNKLLKNINNEHTIVDITIDYEKLFMIIHGNINLLDKLKEFIKSNNKEKLKILKTLENNIHISEILIQYTDISVNNSNYIYNLGKNVSDTYFEILLNDKRINPSTKDNFILFYHSYSKNYNKKLILLILNHPNFSITDKELYYILFHLCIYDNMNKIKFLLNHSNEIVSISLLDIDDIIEFSSAIKNHIKDFDDKLDSYIATAIKYENKRMVIWLLDNAKYIEVIRANLLMFLEFEKNMEYLDLMVSYKQK